ncbi:MAG: hypothetical protein M3Y91_15315, partial [Actinomycetota bacterium]|nr:hypothetical protein [Actinomycetota bacterium]
MTAPASVLHRAPEASVRVMVVGLPGLADALATQPGLVVRAAASDTPLRSALNEVVGGHNPFATVIVAAHGSDPRMEDTALALVRGGYRLVVVNGVGGEGVLCHPEIPSLTAPFMPDDVIALIERLAGPPAGSPLGSPPVVPFDLEWMVPRPDPRPVPGPPAPPPPTPEPPGPWVSGPAVPNGDSARWRAFSPTSSTMSDGRAGIRPQFPGRPRVLVFACPKGGSGKTSLSLTYASFLGAALRPAHRSVVWVDGNLQQADGARYLGADERTSRSIVDLVGQPEMDERSVLDAVTPPEGTGQPISALFGPTFKSDADPRVITADLYRQTVGVLRRHFDYVIVDTPVAEHYDRFFREFALPEADQLIVVVPPLLPVVRGVREWLDMQSQPVAAGGSAFPPANVRLVLNMASERSGCPVEMVRDAWLTRWSWAGEIPYDPAWTAATNNGTLLSERPALAGQFAELVRLTTGDIIDVGG